MRNFLCLLAVFFSASWSAESSDLDVVVASSLPRAFWENLRASEGHEAYALSAWLNPYYLQGDFNGDGQTDFAVLAQEKRTGKRGVLVVHIGANQQFVIGAGNSIGNGGDDFSWMDAWQIYPRGRVGQGADLEAPPPVLMGDALLVIKTESASGLVYWTGTEYQWYPQGD